MRAARELVERAAHGSARAHVRRQHRLRPLRLAVDPRGADRASSSSACSAPTRAGSGSRTPPRSSARRCSCARTRSRRATRARGSRRSSCCSRCLDRGVLPVVPSRGSVGACGDLAPLAHLALPLVGEGEAWVEGERLPGGGGARARRPRAGAAARRRRGSRSSTARSSWRRCGALGLVRARRLARAADVACALSLEALQGSRTTFLPADPRAPAAARAGRLGGERPPAARGLGDHRGAPLVRQGAGRVLAPLRAAGARRVRATSSTTSSTPSRSS